MDARVAVCVNRQLSQNIYERGVDDAGFGRIRAQGDAAVWRQHHADDERQVRHCSKAPTGWFSAHADHRRQEP